MLFHSVFHNLHAFALRLYLSHCLTCSALIQPVSIQWRLMNANNKRKLRLVDLLHNTLFIATRLKKMHMLEKWSLPQCLYYHWVVLKLEIQGRADLSLVVFFGHATFLAAYLSKSEVMEEHKCGWVPVFTTSATISPLLFVLLCGSFAPACVYLCFSFHETPDS